MKKKVKRPNTDIQNTKQKTKTKQHEPHLKPGGGGLNSGAPEGNSAYLLHTRHMLCYSCYKQTQW